jgi:hypothetical protein
MSKSLDLVWCLYQFHQFWELLICYANWLDLNSVGS